MKKERLHHVCVLNLPILKLSLAPSKAQNFLNCCFQSLPDVTYTVSNNQKTSRNSNIKKAWIIICVLQLKIKNKILLLQNPYQTPISLTLPRSSGYLEPNRYAVSPTFSTVLHVSKCNSVVFCDTSFMHIKR